MPEELTIVTAEESAHIDQMPRADAPTIWKSYETRMLELVEIANTLTITDVKEVGKMKIARQTRLSLRQIRIEIEHTRKEFKEDALRRGQRVDADAKKLREMIEPLEERLLLQEQFIEKKQAEEKAALKVEREGDIAAYVPNPTIYKVEEMEFEAFEELRLSLKAIYEQKIAADKKAEDDRLAKEKADRDERARVEAENTRLKKESAAREAAAKKEREEAAAKQAKIEKQLADERKAAEEKAAKIKADADAAALKEKERVAAEQFAAAEKARKEREAADKETARKAKIEDYLLAIRESETDVIRGCKTAAETVREIEFAEKTRPFTPQMFQERWEEAQKLRETTLNSMRAILKQRQDAEALKAKQDAEEAKRKDDAAAEKKAAKAPDREKLLLLADAIGAVPLPKMSTQEGVDASAFTYSEIVKLMDRIKARANSL